MSHIDKKNYTIHIPDRLSFSDLLYLLDNYFWDPAQKQNLGKLKKLLKSFEREFDFVDQVDELTFFRWRSAGPKSWILYQELLSKTKQKQEELKNL